MVVVRECHMLPRRQLVTPALWLPSRPRISLFAAVFRHNQRKGQRPWHFVVLFAGNAIAVRLLSAVNISNGDADDPLGLALFTSDDLFL